MQYQNLKSCNEAEFRRLTGVKKVTFHKMVKLLQEAEKQQKSKGGKPNRLSIEDRLTMSLEYLREYRSYAHIARSYDVAESTAYRNICWFENTLIKDPDFSLPGKKALLKTDPIYEAVLLDATETPIERPKKTETLILWEEEAPHFKNASHRR